MTKDAQVVERRQQACVSVAASNQPGCANTPITPTPNLTTAAIAKIPIVLAELTVRVNVDATITLPEPALEIKQVKKRVKLTQCLLLQDTNTLFLRGFVRKNIDYSTRNVCSNVQGFCGNLRQCTLDTPFRCATAVNFAVPPAPFNFNTTQEFEFFTTQPLGNEFAAKDQLLSGDLTEFNQISTEFFNERPFCELISSRIVEFDEFLGRTRPDNVALPFEEFEFQTIEEKMVLDFTIKILQNRQVRIPATTGG